MAQFLAYVYPEGPGYRVFLEGLGEGTAASLDEAGRVAIAIVARSVFASYPDRSHSTRIGTSVEIALELRIVPAATLSRRAIE